MSDSTDENTGLEIAIIGMAGRFPDAANIEAFWRNLRDGRESVSFFEESELRSAGIDGETLADSSYVKAAAVLDDIELFEASLFGYHRREAEMMDPQHRLFLECVWDVLENAGYDPESYQGLIGVYAGAAVSTYYLANLSEEMTGANSLQFAIANSAAHLTTRASYKLNLGGPSVDVQTACSTSLVAVHLACVSLLSGECDIALAGGVRISVPQKSGHFHREGGIYSPDGHCRAFDADANGMLNGNGVGLVALKRLEDAVRDGDHIHAVVKGSAINNDGSSKVGYTAPGLDGQTRVIRAAQSTAGVDPETITYIEAHGTGTPLGDPIEIAALKNAFGAFTDKRRFCAVGSVKTNVGHLGEAAGIAGLIKTVLSLEHKQIPPSLHFKRPNPQIDFENSPFYINATLSDWNPKSPRRAGVSSFGIGGTNAHVIVEEAPPRQPSGTSRSTHLLVLSARSSGALDTMTSVLAGHLKEHPDLNIADVAYTLQVGRKAFAHKRLLVCGDHDDAVAGLEMREPGRLLTRVTELASRPVAFMFPGQGAQYVGMASELYQSEPEFRQCVDRCSELLGPRLKLDLRRILFPDAQDADWAAQQIKQTFITQPALFVVEYALARLLMLWGIQPQAMIGHSIGEFAAACIAGVFSLEEALELVAVRGLLMQKTPSGAMLAIPLAVRETEKLLNEKIDIAAINGLHQSVVSGEPDAIDLLRKELDRQSVLCKPLETSFAFHSSRMDSILSEFAAHVRRIELKPPSVPFISNLTGTWIKPEEAMSAEYWARHLRQTVRFSDGLAELLKEPTRILLEVGPGSTLSSLTRRHPDRTSHQPVVSSLRRREDNSSDIAFLLASLGKLWLEGVEVDWRAFHVNERRNRVPLPPTIFEREPYWLGPVGSRKDKSHEVRVDESHLRARAAVSRRPPVGRRLALHQLDVMNQQVNVMDRQLTLLGDRAEGEERRLRSNASFAESIPLTPIQRWFFEQQVTNPPDHWNMALALKARSRLDPGCLKAATQHLVSHHDALRLRFTRQTSGWKQFQVRREESDIFSVFDYSVLSEQEQRRAFESAAARLQTSLSLSKGPLIRLAWFDLGPKEPGRLLLIVHHLAIDLISRQILLEDLQACYDELINGRPPRPLRKTASFSDWAKSLHRHASSKSWRKELSWVTRNVDDCRPLPTDYLAGQHANTEGSARTVTTELSPDETNDLLLAASGIHRARTSEVVLLALARVFAQWSESRAALFDLEGHGREAIIDGLDLSRTVGWFTTLYPVAVESCESDDHFEAIASLKEQLRSIPDGGIGYGLLRNHSKDGDIAQTLRTLPRPELSFNFVGRFYQAALKHSEYDLDTWGIGALRCPTSIRPHLIDINAMMLGGRLRIEYKYSENLHQASTIERLARETVRELRALTNSSEFRKGVVHA